MKRIKAAAAARVAGSNNDGIWDFWRNDWWSMSYLIHQFIWVYYTMSISCYTVTKTREIVYLNAMCSFCFALKSNSNLYALQRVFKVLD